MSVVSLAWLMGCPPAQQLQRCNADVDCEIGLSCQNGTCVVDDTLDPGGTPDPGVAPESDSGPPPDGGPGDIDGGPSTDGGLGPNDSGPDDGGPVLTDGGPINNDGGPSDWWDSNWSSRRAVVVSLPAVVDEVLSDVPVLITLTFEDVPGVSQDFSDIRFVDVNGNLLDFEREGYADDGATFWVAFAALSPGTDTEIYVYWGNEGASALPYASDVWRNGYKGVWNLNAGLQNHADVTLRAPSLLRGADILFTPSGGLNLDGSNEVAVVANYTDIAQDVDVVTISARFRAENTSRHQIIAAISVGSTSTEDRSRASIALIEGAGFQIYGRHHDNEPYVDHETPLDLYVADEWNHVVGILDYVGGVVEIYLNGVMVFSEEQSFDLQLNDWPARRIVIGGEDDTNGAHFDGVIDDVRISDVRRSPAWIAFEAAQQAGVFVLGASETRSRVEVGQPPVATNDNFELVEDAEQTFFTLTDNDSDDEVTGFGYLFIDSLGDSTLGTLQITPDGRGIAFEPFSNVFGSEDIAYTVSDGVNGIDDGVVAINVASVNDIPNARFDRASVRVGETALVDVRANDSDVETASDAFTVEVLTEAERASVVDGQIVFETDGLVAGEIFEVRYRITDDAGGADTATLYIGMHASPVSLEFLDYSGLFSHGISGRPYGMSVVDINLDGILDVATIGGSGSRVSLGSEDFSLQEIYEGPNGRALQFANIDNTGPLEFVNTDEEDIYTLSNGAVVEVPDAAGFTIGVDSMVWNDYDGDGDIDMFVVDRSDPFVYFKENDADLTFVDDVTKVVGPDLNRGMSTSADINGDGRADFLIIADRPYLFVSGTDEGFVDETDARGLGGVSTDDVGVSFGDCDNDGDLDLFIGGRYDASPKLFINDQGVFDEKASFSFRVKNAVGVALGDVDNDGDLDAFIGEGNSGSPIKYDHGSLMLLNDGNCNFVDVAYELGLDAQSTPVAGAVLVDSDRDGDLDLLANRYSASSVGVYVNQLSHNFSFRVVVRGAGGPGRSPVDGHGTEIFLTTAAPGNTTITQMRHISGGEGYYSQGPNEAHFGLGAADPASVDVLVRFSSGVEVPLTITNLAASVDDGPRSIIVTEPPLATP